MSASKLRSEGSMFFLLLGDQCPDSLEGKFLLKLLGESVVVFQDGLYQVARIPQLDLEV